MNKKVRDVKIVSKTKHVNVEDQTKETSIDVHKDNKTEAKKNTKKKEIDEPKIISKQSDTEEKTSPKKQTEEFDPKKMRVVFMGTGIFASNILETAIKYLPAKNLTIVTQPDKKIGRRKSSIHRSLAPNPVREFAKKHNIELLQPTELNDEFIEQIKTINPNIITVSSYGKILPKKLLDIPKFKSINVHASLLPKLRGASPVQNALLAGYTETGVTIMKMDEGLDTGDIIAQEKVKIEEHEKADELLIRLSKIGAKLLVKTARKWINGQIKAKPQDNSQATLCQLIDREDGHIQWTQDTQEIYNRYRALYPWPGVFSFWENKDKQLTRLKFRALYPLDADLLSEDQKKLKPGTVFIGKDQLCVKTFDSALIIEAIQPECKVVMPVYDFLNGHKDFEGSVLH